MVTRMVTRLVVIGGNGAGMSAASQARRRQPQLDIIALEKGHWTSYSECGIPYLVGGEIDEPGVLVSRSPDQFRAMRIDARIGQVVTGIDLDDRSVEVHNLRQERIYRLHFDLLHVATGAVPVRPDVPGIDSPHVHGVQTLDDATRLLEAARTDRPSQVVVVGGGYIGLELAEAFLQRGAGVTVVDRSTEVMRTLDPELGVLVGQAMQASGVSLRLGETLTGIEEGAVHTDAGEIPADLVVLGAGVAPDSRLAAEAGLATGVKGAVVVDRQQRTSAEGVWAAGDCCQSYSVVTGLPTYQALGTVANKQGRVAGINISGGYATFGGVAGTAVTRICSTEIGRTGCNEREAVEAGFTPVSSTVVSTTVAAYLGEATKVTLKLVAESGTGRVLGMQIVGGPGSAKRVDVVATALHAGMDVEDLIGLDLAYAPPFASVWEVVQVAARDVATRLR
jgi:NADPH-dependent 2,4-dienoyl-CoA reductase/sulfur reductase-like enzyme